MTRFIIYLGICKTISKMKGVELVDKDYDFALETADDIYDNFDPNDKPSMTLKLKAKLKEYLLKEDIKDEK